MSIFRSSKDFCYVLTGEESNWKKKVERFYEKTKNLIPVTAYLV